MGKAHEIKQLLEKIHRTNANQRAGLINRVQDIILDQTITLNEGLQQELAALATDLDFYDENADNREDDLGYYGEEQLLEKISTAVEKIDDFLEEK